MKKTLLSFFALFASISAFSQLAAGSQAPDFTATDINGNTHTLSSYLAQGKTVIIDISATWCGPCWNYHNSHALEDLYNSYGPGGSNEVVVLFVEGDGSTTLADLHGTGTNTQGDWTAGTPYPIIDSAAIANLYEITYFPTVYRICPSGIVTEIGSASAASIRTGINNNCGATLTGVQNQVEAYDNTIGICQTAGTGTAAVKLRNLGSNSITAAVVNIKENGTVVATKNFAGTFNQFTNKTITFDPMAFNQGSTYTFEVASANGNPMYNGTLSASDLTTEFSTDTTQNIEVRVYTDNWPTEISWNIKNSAGVTVASGGPYVGDANNGGGADANTTKIHSVALPTVDECYTINLIDSYGDGWGLGNTPHGMEIFADGTSVLNIPVDNFGGALAKQNALRTVATMGTDMFAANKPKIYPNPSTGIVSFEHENIASIEVVDLTGKVLVSKTENITNSLDLTNLNDGVYFVKINSNNKIVTEKIIIKK